MTETSHKKSNGKRAPNGKVNGYTVYSHKTDRVFHEFAHGDDSKKDDFLATMRRNVETRMRGMRERHEVDD